MKPLDEQQRAAFQAHVQTVSVEVANRTATAICVRAIADLAEAYFRYAGTHYSSADLLTDEIHGVLDRVQAEQGEADD